MPRDDNKSALWSSVLFVILRPSLICHAANLSSVLSLSPMQLRSVASCSRSSFCTPMHTAMHTASASWRTERVPGPVPSYFHMAVGLAGRPATCRAGGDSVPARSTVENSRLWTDARKMSRSSRAYERRELPLWDGWALFPSSHVLGRWPRSTIVI